MKECLQCRWCKHYWLPRKKKSERCPNRRCRRLDWDIEEKKVLKKVPRGTLDPPPLETPKPKVVLVSTRTKCPICSAELVPFGMSKRCQKCERNF